MGVLADCCKFLIGNPEKDGNAILPGKETCQEL
jgi:hypothetical protein